MSAMLLLLLLLLNKPAHLDHGSFPSVPPCLPHDRCSQTVGANRLDSCTLAATYWQCDSLSEGHLIPGAA